MTELESDFSAYAEARWSALVRSAVVMGCDLNEAEDVAQSALVKCFKAWAAVTRADNIDAYVYRILLNCFRDHRRRRSWGERPTARMPDAVTPDSTSQFTLVDSVHRALRDLTDKEREVIVLRFFAQLNERETASALRIPPGTVKSRLSRGLAHLATNRHLIDLPEELNS